MVTDLRRRNFGHPAMTWTNALRWILSTRQTEREELLKDIGHIMDQGRVGVWLGRGISRHRPGWSQVEPKSNRRQLNYSGTSQSVVNECRGQCNILTLSISPTKCFTTLNTPRKHIRVAAPTATKRALMTSGSSLHFSSASLSLAWPLSKCTVLPENDNRVFLDR